MFVCHNHLSFHWHTQKTCLPHTAPSCENPKHSIGVDLVVWWRVPRPHWESQTVLGIQCPNHQSKPERSQNATSPGPRFWVVGASGSVPFTERPSVKQSVLCGYLAGHMARTQCFSRSKHSTTVTPFWTFVCLFVWGGATGRNHHVTSQLTNTICRGNSSWGATLLDVNL